MRGNVGYATSTESCEIAGSVKDSVGKPVLWIVPVAGIGIDFPRCTTGCGVSNEEEGKGCQDNRTAGVLWKFSLER